MAGMQLFNSDGKLEVPKLADAPNRKIVFVQLKAALIEQE